MKFRFIEFISWRFYWFKRTEGDRKIDYLTDLLYHIFDVRFTEHWIREMEVQINWSADIIHRFTHVKVNKAEKIFFEAEILLNFHFCIICVIQMNKCVEILLIVLSAHIHTVCDHLWFIFIVLYIYWLKTPQIDNKMFQKIIKTGKKFFK